MHFLGCEVLCEVVLNMPHFTELRAIVGNCASNVAEFIALCPKG